MSIIEVFLDPEPPLSCNTNIPELNQKFIVGNNVKCFVEVQVEYITRRIAIETVVNYIQTRVAVELLSAGGERQTECQ